MNFRIGQVFPGAIEQIRRRDVSNKANVFAVAGSEGMLTTVHTACSVLTGHFGFSHRVMKIV